jgi:sigma-E factor negative regulatory protein RseA
MTQEISSLMDGEMAAAEADRAIRTCSASADQKTTWYLYHAIGDTMRGQAPRRLALPDDVIESLKAVPTVLAPRRALHQSTFARIALAAAASVATIGVVGWIGSQGGQVSSVPAVAKSSSAIQPVANKARAPESPALNVQDYLAAHRQIPSAELYRPVTNRAPSAAR